jgi:hypothetical protein
MVSRTYMVYQPQSRLERKTRIEMAAQRRDEQHAERRQVGVSAFTASAFLLLIVTSTHALCSPAHALLIC